jgi:hypothetical protein
MNWVQYAEYLERSTDFTSNQAHAVAGSLYGIKDERVSDELNTSTDTVRVQKSRIEFNSIEEEKKYEFFKTPVPNVPFKLVGEVDYWHSDYWPNESSTGDVLVYFSTKESDSYVVVIEKYKKAKKAELMNPDDEGVVAVVEEVEKTTIYKSSKDFADNSVHSPRLIPEDAPDIELDKRGELYN